MIIHPDKYINRETGKPESEVVMGGALINFIHDTLAGRMLWPFFFGTGTVSKLMGSYFSSRFSHGQIAKTVESLSINMHEAEYPAEHYGAFNEFFTRKLKDGARPFDSASERLVSAWDGRIIVFENVGLNDKFPVKGADYTLNAICDEQLPDDNYAVAVVWLCPSDYHHYHFPCDCSQLKPRRYLKGKYHSVNPVALARYPRLYAENERSVNVLKSDVFGEFRYVEVGAFGVGAIVETAEGTEYKKMDTKGHFLFGGSTIILVLSQSKVKFDEDLLKATSQGYGTRLKVGESIGTAVSQ